MKIDIVAVSESVFTTSIKCSVKPFHVTYAEEDYIDWGLSAILERSIVYFLPKEGTEVPEIASPCPLMNYIHLHI